MEYSALFLLLNVRKTLKMTASFKLFSVLFRASIVSLIFFELLPVIHLIYAFFTNGDLEFQLPVQMHFVCPTSLQCPYTYALAYIFQLFVGKFIVFLLDNGHAKMFPRTTTLIMIVIFLSIFNKYKYNILYLNSIPV